MATVTCEVTVKNDRGEVVQKFPSTNKTFAKQIGKSRASKIGGEYEVKTVTPYEFQPKSE